MCVLNFLVYNNFVKFYHFVTQIELHLKDEICMRDNNGNSRLFVLIGIIWDRNLDDFEDRYGRCLEERAQVV